MSRVDVLLVVALLVAMSCQQKNDKMKEISELSEYKPGTFGYNLTFVSNYSDVVVLKDKAGKPCIITSPEYQGRILTSSFDGMEGKSLGFINHKRIASNEIVPHTQGYGGEDRLWIGPQGGQYTMYFKPGDPFDFDHWFTPSDFDTEPFELVSASDSSVVYRKVMEFRNYVNTVFDLEVNREIKLIELDEAGELLGLGKLHDLKYVGFESKNKVTNTGGEGWKKESGLISIWILGMFPGGSTIIVPYDEALESEHGTGYSEYFADIIGNLNGQHLTKGKNNIFYNGSGDYIGKIGVRPEYTKPYIGSFDEENRLLTIVQYMLPEGETDYVNSQWKIQKEPYKGDVVNAYNDGPLDRKPGAEPTFYELESSSPALELGPGESQEYYHRTFHFQGSTERLDEICKVLFGTSLESIEQQFTTNRH